MSNPKEAAQGQTPRRQARELPPIVCAVTLDANGQACLRYAWQRAINTGQPLTVVHIAHQTMRSAGIYQQQNCGNRLLPLAEIAQQLLGKFVGDFLGQLAADAPKVSAAMIDKIVEPGIPGSRIPEIAERIGATSIVVGGTRRSAWQRRLRGSVTGDLLRRTSTPVFVIDAVGQPIDPRDFLPDLQGKGNPNSVLGLP